MRSTDKPTPHVEIWGHFVATHRFFKRLTVACVVWAFLALAGAAYGVLTAMHRPLVFAVDADGRASAQGRVGDNLAPLDVEVRYVAKRFLQRTMGFHSETVESDLAEGFNLMTDELRATMAAEFDAYEADANLSFVAFVKRQQIRTVLEFRSVETQNHSDTLWTVVVRGLATTWPLNRVGEDAGHRTREFEAQLTLSRAPRTELTPNGLLVSAQSTAFFEVAGEAAQQEERVTGSPSNPPGGSR